MNEPPALPASKPWKRPELNSLKRTLQPEGFFRASTGRFLHKKLNILALTILGLIVLLSLSAGLISRNLLNVAPERTNLLETFKAPGFTEVGDNGLIIHYLGTDELGRDTLARLIHAGGGSLTVGFIVMGVVLGLGIPLGLAAGYYQGWIDDIINAAIQFINNIPTLYIFIITSQIFTPNIIYLSLLFGLFGWGGTARQVRSLTLSLRTRDFVLASKVMGAGDARLLFQHILPNLTSILLVLAANDIAHAMLAEAALSFLGFGIRDPDVSWGKLLSRSSDYLTYAGNENIFLILGPGIAIFITVFAIYLIADGLRDAFDTSL